MRPSPRPALIPLLAVLAASPLPAQEPGAAGADPLPEVHVLATGGTISNIEGDRLTGVELVRSLPGIEEVARISVEQFTNVASSALSLDDWLALARRIDALYRERPALAGIVVTHGTDTMEETAYFLDLTVRDCRPVVVTGAMRRADDPGADGPANLFNGIRLAADGGAGELGTVVLMNDEVLPAREVTKVHTSRVDAFTAPGGGPVGVVDPDAVVLRAGARARTCGTPAFDLSGVEALPRVDVIHSHLGADGALIRAAVDAGARGLVVATVGRGNSPPGQREAVADARERGVAVVLSSRTGAGRVPVRRAEPDPGRGALLGAGDLTPQKARILLQLALTRSDEPRVLRELFEAH